MWVILLLLDLGLAFIPATIASGKGRSFGVWYVYGLFLWLIAFIHALCIKEEYDEEIVNVSQNREDNGIQQYSINIPLIIKNYSIMKVNNEKLKLSILFFNIGDIPIEAVKINAYGYNSFGEPINISGKNFFEILIQDMDLNSGESKNITLSENIPDSSIRKLELKITQVLLKEGMPMIAQHLNFGIDRQRIVKEEEKAILYHANVFFRYLKSIYYPKQNAQYWLCACGYINPDGENTCSYCHTEREKVFSAQKDIKYSQSKKEIEIEEELHPEKVKQNKSLKYKILFGVIIVIIVLTTGYYIGYLNKQKDVMKSSFPKMKKEKQEEIFDATTQNLNTYLNIIGTTLEEAESLPVDESFLNGLGDVSIVGKSGTMTHHTTESSGDIVSLAEWKSNEEYSEKEFLDFKDNISDYYNQSAIETSYENIAKKCFCWKEDKYNIIAWFDSDHMFIRWYLKESFY